MKKLMAVAMALCCLLALAGCSIGVPRAEYDKVVAERDELAARLETLGEAAVTPEASQAPEQSKEPVKERFNSDTVLTQLDVTEYSYGNDWWNYAFLVIKNNSEYDLEISADVRFYNEAGELVGAKSSSENAFEGGTETLLYFMPDEAFERMEYELTVSEEKWYDGVVSDLSYEMSPAKDKEIVSVTNNGDGDAEFVKGYMLFFSGDSVVGFDSAYFVDDDSELKAGKTISEELDCHEEYDSVKLYLTGRK